MFVSGPGPGWCDGVAVGGGRVSRPSVLHETTWATSRERDRGMTTATPSADRRRPPAGRVPGARGPGGGAKT